MSDRIRKIAVVGATFGRMYVAAIGRRPDLELAALVGRGSELARHTAATAGVPLLTSLDDLADNVPGGIDLVCVAVRAGSVGGAGTRIAVQLLERGMAVLQELPVGSHDVVECLRAAQRGSSYFAVADHYRQLPAVRAFCAAASELTATQQPLAIDAHLSIQPAWALAQLLTGIGIPVRPFSFTVIDGRGLVTGSLAGVPVSVRYATLLDAHDTDNDVRFPGVTIHTAAGTLTLTDVHGRIVWTPNLHLPSDSSASQHLGRTGRIGDLQDTPVTEELFAGEGTHATVLTDLWPTAIGNEIADVLRAVRTGSGPANDVADRHRAAQQTLQTAQLWEALTAGVDFPATTTTTDGFDERSGLLHRLRGAVRTATAGTGKPAGTRPDTDEEPR